MPRTRSSLYTADVSSLSAQVLPEFGIAASSRFEFLAAEEESVFIDEFKPDSGWEVLWIAFPPTSSGEDLHLRSPAGLESSRTMPHLEPYWKDDFVFRLLNF